MAEMTTKIMVPHGGMKMIEEKLSALDRRVSQPTIRRALRGKTPMKSKISEYKLLRAIALEIGGMEIKSK